MRQRKDAKADDSREADASRSKKSSSSPPPSPPPRQARVHVVGVGASAGGLEALGELLHNVPMNDTAFIIVLHLSPDSPSLLTQLLARESAIEVALAEEGAAIVPNKVYVLPPNAFITVDNGHLRLSPLPDSTPRFPVDVLFRSLAATYAEQAVGVVLSGTGTDGTEGLRAIQERGGITFAQSPASARYDGMPRSAIGARTVSFCLTPTQIGAELGRLVAEIAQGLTPKAARSDKALARSPLYALIKAEFGVDLADYKEATLERRIDRRMAIQKQPTLENYVALARANRGELRALYQDLLITVTNFFRDPEAFATLREQVLPRLIKRHMEQEPGPIRVWSVGCATGEEAYSLAMCLTEAADDASWDAGIQVFATDLSEESVEIARRGVYAANIAADVGPERLRRFFVRKRGEYHICRQVRDVMVFSKHNLLTDAPFSRIDLVTCRNLLIYLQSPAQKRALRLLHYALKPGGYLMLGASETVGDVPDVFNMRDRKNKIYQRRHGVQTLARDAGPVFPHHRKPEASAGILTSGQSVQRTAERKLLDIFVPPGVIVNSRLEIIYFRGHTGPYLNPSPGAASFNVLRLARPELHVHLQRLASEALARSQHVRTQTHYVDRASRHGVVLHAIPVQGTDQEDPCLIILFEKMQEPEPSVEEAMPSTSGGSGQTPADPSKIAEIERELGFTKDCLQATIEEKETAIEEMKASNEELQSANEELQSTNEELETSKEEMQSANEELTTVNEELQNRMSELGQIHDDLQNIQLAADNAVVVVSMDLRLRRFTTAAERMLNLIASDVGREVSYLEKFLRVPDLLNRVSDVIGTLTIFEVEVLTAAGRWCALRIVPYKTLDHNIRGAVLSVTDCHLRRKCADFSGNIQAYAERLYGLIRSPIAVVDEALHICWTNVEFTKLLHVTADDLVGETPQVFGARYQVDDNLRNIMKGALATGDPFSNFALRDKDAPDDRRRELVVSGAFMPDVIQRPMLVITARLTSQN